MSKHKLTQEEMKKRQAEAKTKVALARRLWLSRVQETADDETEKYGLVAYVIQQEADKDGKLPDYIQMLVCQRALSPDALEKNPDTGGIRLRLDANPRDVGVIVKGIEFHFLTSMKDIRVIVDDACKSVVEKIKRTVEEALEVAFAEAVGGQQGDGLEDEA